MRNLPLLLVLFATPAFAQPLRTNCRPTPDGLAEICDLVESITEADLANKPFLDKSTFATVNSSGWSRDSVELEGAMEVTCADGPTLMKLLRTERNGRTVYQRLRRPEVMEAFAADYGIDEMPWDGNSHRVREASPYVWLTIESGRFEPDPANGGERRLSVGTDIMDDVYYDTADYKLLENDMALRGRARWDTPTEIRRLLIGAKMGSGIDEFGLKRAAKIDIRTDSASADDIAKLDTAVRGGFHEWDSSPTAIQPVREVYARLAAAGKLSDVGTHEDVLLLEPKAYLRSTRSRFHLNEARINSVKTLFDEGGAGRLKGVAAQIAAARAAGQIPASQEARVAAFEAKVTGILENTAVAEKAKAALLKIDPQMDVNATTVAALLPGAGRPADAADLAKRKAVADAVSALYHETATELDGVRRTITASDDRAFEDEPARFAAWLRSTSPALAKTTTYDPIEKAYADIAKLGDAEKAAKLAEYNTWAQAQKDAGERDFRNWNALDAGGFAKLGPQVTNEKVRIWQRQLEAAGSAASGLWFDQARTFFVPDSSRSTGNFLIDTMDMTEMYSPEAWNSIPATERTADKKLPAEKSFHTVLVNELQIELGLEKPYLDRIAALADGIEKDRAALFMKYAKDAGLAAEPADAEKLLAELKKKSAAELKDTVDALNESAKASGGKPFTATSLKEIDKANLTAAVRDREITLGQQELALQGARFVFEQYRNQLKSLSALKGERVLRTLRNAGGPACMEWKDIEKSKGDRALEMTRDAEMRHVPNG